MVSDSIKQLTNKDIDSLNQWQAYLSYKETWIWHMLINCRAHTIAIFAGNRFGKTATLARSIVLRVSGCHPVPEANFNFLTCNPEDVWGLESLSHRWSLLNKIKPHKRHGLLGDKCPICRKPLVVYHDPHRVGRCASESLPKGGSDSKGANMEVKNTQYPALKKWLPQYLVIDEPSIRNQVLSVADPIGGPPIQFEFVSYSQSVQAQAGVSRKFIWVDEQPPYAFYDENRYRLIDSHGQMLIGLTPAESMTYLYDDVYCQARVYYRTKTIAELLGVPRVQVTGSKASIAVFQASTDDNPVLDKKFIEERFAEVTDEDEIMIRRHGIFRQVGGTIFKEYDPRIHFIDSEQYFKEGVPHGWTHARLVDYHQRTPWAVLCVALSPDNEAFAYMEYNPDPTRTTTYAIARELAMRCGSYKYHFDLADQLASQIQVNTGRTTIQDLNDYFLMFKRDEHLGTGAFFRAWDVKGTRGREEIQLRLHNAKKCLRPFNNKITENGRTKNIPTLWILNTCPITSKSMLRWRWEEWVSASDTKEAKASPEQKYSHFPMCLEAIFKEVNFQPRRGSMAEFTNDPRRYFNSARA